MCGETIWGGRREAGAQAQSRFGSIWVFGGGRGKCAGSDRQWYPVHGLVGGQNQNAVFLARNYARQTHWRGKRDALDLSESVTQRRGPICVGLRKGGWRFERANALGGECAA